MTDSLLKESLIKLKQNSKFSDISIKLPNCDPIKLHRCVLASRSVKFKMMFESELKEGSQEVVPIDSQNPELFKKMLNWIYSSEIDFPEEDNAIFELVLLADEYFLEDLRRKCEDELLFRVDGDNSLDILIASYKHKTILSENFVETCISTLVEDFDVTMAKMSDEKIEQKLFGKKNIFF